MLSVHQPAIQRASRAFSIYPPNRGPLASSKLSLPTSHLSPHFFLGVVTLLPDLVPILIFFILLLIARVEIVSIFVRIVKPDIHTVLSIRVLIGVFPKFPTVAPRIGGDRAEPPLEVSAVDDQVSGAVAVVSARGPSALIHWAGYACTAACHDDTRSWSLR